MMSEDMDGVRKRATVDPDRVVESLSPEDRAILDHAVSKQTSNFNFTTIMWMTVAIMLFNYLDFAMVVTYDIRIKRYWFNIGLAMIGVNLLIGAYLVIYMSYYCRKPDWKNHTHPALIPISTLFGVLGLLFCTIGLWPVWGVFTPFILFVLFMGVVMLATLLPF